MCICVSRCATVITERQQRILNIIERLGAATVSEIYRNTDCSFTSHDQVRSVLSILRDKGLVVYSYTWGEYRTTCASYCVSYGAYGNPKAAWCAPSPVCCAPVVVEKIYVPVIATPIPPLKELVHPSKLTGADRFEYLVKSGMQYAIPE